MTSRILRWSIGLTDLQYLTVPAPGRILSVARSRTVPDHGIDLWTVGEDSAEKVTRTIYVVGTGNLMPDPGPMGMDFVGTVVTPSGLVWHVFADRHTLWQHR
jgi:hypothetical protein